METIVTGAEMRSFDIYAVNKLKIPSLILMENAGRGVVEMMIKHYGSLSDKSVIIFCGKGNNGGDGFVVARHLLNQGANVIVVCLSKPSVITGDAKLNYNIIKRIERDTTKKRPQLLVFNSRKTLNILPESDFIVDAMFGTGFSGAIKGSYEHVIKWMNGSSAIKVSIDIPSGVNADTGSVENLAVKADLTVTMGMKKIGLLTCEGKSYVGKIEVTDIGIPKSIKIKPQPTSFTIEENDVREILPSRPLDAHKHSVGKIFILAGSRGLTGAAAMSAISAMRVGAGAVVLGTPKSIYPVLAKKLTEVMVKPLGETSDGSLSYNSYRDIQDQISWADVLIVGPGLSRNNETQRLVWKILKECDKPMLIDADGLNAVAEKMVLLKRRKSKNLILTPHTGELSRLIKMSSNDIEKKRVEVARSFTSEFKITLVLKGSPTVTASPKGMTYINSTGNPGMATAGSGDILSGMIAGLWAQGMGQTKSAYSGVYLHGLAGDIAKDKLGEKSLLAMDINQYIPNAIMQIEGAKRTH